MKSRKTGYWALCGLALMAACGDNGDAFETQGRFIESRYKEDGSLQGQ